MSVLIRGMEMPKSCPCELLGIGYDLYCSFVGDIPARVKEYYECCQNDTRPSWCPLVPVPPHGRLGDLDVLYSEMETYSDYCGAKEYHDDEMIHRDSILYAIEQAPTVIPAEEDET